MESGPSYTTHPSFITSSGGHASLQPDWLAASADEIYANGASIIGSIGVVSAGFGFDRAIERLGIDRRVYTAGERKAILDPFRPEAEEDVARLKSLQAEIHQQFIAHVVERRGGKLKGAHEDLFSGAFWSGETAVGLGLVDGLGDCRSVVTRRFGEEVDLMTIQPKKKLFSGIGGLSGSMAGAAAASVVATPPAASAAAGTGQKKLRFGSGLDSGIRHAAETCSISHTPRMPRLTG
mgnify:CR=1 FL=1